jgi:YopX protein
VRREVIFKDGVFGIEPNGKWNMEEWKIIPLFIPRNFMQQDVEVLGNLYENPELLQVNK